MQGRRGLKHKLGRTVTADTYRREQIRARRAAGQPCKQIAAELAISFWTVHKHVKALKRERRHVSQAALFPPT